jgi:hypothetical protein
MDGGDMPRDWTPEERAKQRAVIMASKPWLKSTGPRTKRGKKICAQNPSKPASLEQWWYCDDAHEQRLIWRRLWRAPQGNPHK